MRAIILTIAISVFNFASATEVQKIEWHKWGRQAFEQAQQENKMILIDVGVKTCIACKWMEEGTYQDPDVVALLKKNFLAIKIDADEQPELGSRYIDWAWPALIFLSPDGEQVLALRGNRRPRNFIPILNTLVEKQASGELKRDGQAPAGIPFL